MNGRKKSQSGGYSLLEMLVYVAVLAVGINLFVSALSSGSRLSAVTTLQLGRIEGIRDVQDTFTGLVRRAAAVVPEAGAYTTGGQTVVLRMPPGQPEGFSYIVIGAVRDPERFSVLGLNEAGDVWTSDYLRNLRQPLSQLRFEVNTDGVRPVVAMTVQVKRDEGERGAEALVHRALATPRGALGGTP